MLINEICNQRRLGVVSISADCGPAASQLENSRLALAMTRGSPRHGWG